MIRLNRESLYNKIRGCWRGKSMGSALGSRFEGMVCMVDVVDPTEKNPAMQMSEAECLKWIDQSNREADVAHPEKNPIIPVTGFLLQPGETMPNDDLDLQMIWLMAVDELGIEAINARTLCEFWLDFVDPYWNEYGRSKVNVREGLLPPISGEFRNGTWRNSNGAWLRTEIWACLLPGRPDEAARLALEDGSVDHGYFEGTFAACFIAALESAAFITSDLRTLVEIGLSKVPENCYVARYVRRVLAGYDAGEDYRDLRNCIYAQAVAEHVGPFGAPNNVAFVVLGLLYGGGDFKTTIRITINCTDDTDCTAATVGAILGAIHGVDCIPEDWKPFVADELKSISLLEGAIDFPRTVTDVIEHILRILPRTCRLPSLFSRGAYRWYNEKAFITIVDGETDFDGFDPQVLARRSGYLDYALSHSGKSMHFDTLHADIWIVFDEYPQLHMGQTLKGHVALRLKLSPSQKCYHVSWYAPEGWRVDSARNIAVMQEWWYDRVIDAWPEEKFTFEIVPGERIEAQNRLVLSLQPTAHGEPILLPITVLG